MNEVHMTHDKAIEIIKKFQDELFLNGSVTTNTDKEKALLMDALNMQVDSIEDNRRYQEISKCWNELQEKNKKK
jgi:hypothetical protein